MSKFNRINKVKKDLKSKTDTVFALRITAIPAMKYRIVSFFMKYDLFIQDTNIDTRTKKQNNPFSPNDWRYKL